MSKRKKEDSLIDLPVGEENKKAKLFVDVSLKNNDSDNVDNNSESSPRFWTKEEDDALRAAVVRFGRKNWKFIAAVVPHRTHVQCLQRWNKVLKPGLVKGSWSDEEDNVLREAVAKLKATNSDKPNWKCNWSKIAFLVPGRTAKQCRERWRCNLDPNINKNDWTEGEDSILLQLQSSIGNRWALIAKSLPGRTENAIKTRFRSIQRARKKEWSPDEDRVILEMRSRKGCRWETIAEALPNRTKNGVKVRHRHLINEQTMGNKNVANKQSEGKKNRTENKTRVKKVSNKSLKRESKQTSENIASNSLESKLIPPFYNNAAAIQTQIALANMQALQFRNELLKNQMKVHEGVSTPISTPMSHTQPSSNYSWTIDPKDAEKRAAATLLNMASQNLTKLEFGSQAGVKRVLQTAQ